MVAVLAGCQWKLPIDATADRAQIMKIDGALSSVAVGAALTYPRSEIGIVGAKVL